MSKFVSSSKNIDKSINWFNVKQEADAVTFSSVELLDWNKISELHILGSNESDFSKFFCNAEGSSGVRDGFISKDESVLCLIGVELENIKTYINKCTTNLKELDIRFTDLEEIDLSSLTSLERLILSNNEILTINGLNKLNNITTLTLKNISQEMDIDLNKFPSLYSLTVRNSNVKRLILNKQLKSLNYLDASGSAISDLSLLKYLPSLKILTVNGTNITALPDISHLKFLKILNISNNPITKIPPIKDLNNLTSLNVGFTKIDSLENFEFPISLRSINLSGTLISEIPEKIKDLQNLRRLNLSHLNLNKLPLWLPDLKLEFVKEKGFGIILANTVIQSVDMSIFDQPRIMIEKWFSSLKNATNGTKLNEVKVVFLGDGGAGKSLTIKRLLSQGEIPESFDGTTTPGIAISNKTYTRNNRHFKVNYWDFGGQEILHSMHRMFLTERTFYVVLINARDNTQDERARYWLNNIKSFANSSPVLLVLNQIDQNPNASINESSLKMLYPQLTKTVRLSSAKYSVDEFLQFEDTLLDEICKMPSIDEPFMESWSLLKEKLQNMQENYINDEEYCKLSKESGVETDEKIKNSLLEWFSDLGISFCYKDNSVLSNYMILRPDWITNAIYIILFNCSNANQNGLIKHTTIHRLLSLVDADVTKSVLSDVRYTPEEIEYVLGVIRKFRLSYRIDDETEFIPMLCERNEKPIVNDFIGKENVLELHMVYSYLPNNVIHRLMVEMRLHLDINNVWLTGAVFNQKSIGISALVKIEDNVFEIFVKSTNSLHPANTYLSIIKDTIARINESLGLTAEEKIIYHNEGKEDCFDYSYLIGSYKHGNYEIYSQKFGKNIKILDILKQTDKEIVDNKQKLYSDIINACQKLQANKMYYNASEDERNTFIRDLLRTNNYLVMDQTFSGESKTRKSAGELDLEIRESPEKVWTVYEALNVTSFSDTNKVNWNEHLQRLLDNYNPIGYSFVFLVTYLNCNKDNLKNVWLDFSEHISSYSPTNYLLQNIKNIDTNNFYIKSAECVYDRGGLPTTVYHICVRVGD